jgi:UDPglucose--hexose-1-phosphate uridylyltransferase
VLELNRHDLPDSRFRPPSSSREIARPDPSWSESRGEPWLVRVVPNKYPAILPTDPESKRACEPYQQKFVGGFQEIVIESPRHVASLGELSWEETFLTLRAFQQRVHAAAQDPSIRHVGVFKNCRPEAGASLEHAHSQLVFSRFAGDAVRRRWQRCDEFFQAQQSPLLAAMLQFELNDPLRLVTRSDSFVSFCPFASRFAYLVWIMPTHSLGEFQSLGAELLVELAEQLQQSVRRIERALNHPPYNLLLHLPPPPLHRGDTQQRAAHGWFFEIVPRLGRMAGWELLGGGWINESPPESAAAQLRSADLS